MRIFQFTITALLTICTISFTGCGSRPTADSTSESAPGSSDPHDHDHPSEGPHHGTLVELGDEEYHAEVVHDADSVTIYMLGASAKAAVPIAAPELTINLVHDGTPEQFTLSARPQENEPEGKSSRFTIEDAELVSHLDDESAAPRLSVTIEGTSFQGAIEHDHDHAGHDHAH
ncbi:hypothetical protein [Allorhodopirellula solitaria]|uniref:Uncharacterized protein n=1 Tax=Allorhodopirellula solitaria TaxID=2527987 RepID=A0A5C5XXY2_9BACT|nr:hypothetical protein [Allorhodopirellula solitaria]TWT67371.1 hypothetical protein CA85_22210 [Allorhodopirellula solitaria]